MNAFTEGQLSCCASIYLCNAFNTLEILSLPSSFIQMSQTVPNHWVRLAQANNNSKAKNCIHSLSLWPFPNGLHSSLLCPTSRVSFIQYWLSWKAQCSIRFVLITETDIIVWPCFFLFQKRPNPLERLPDNKEDEITVKAVRATTKKMGTKWKR